MNLQKLTVLDKYDPEDGLAEWESGVIKVFNKSILQSAMKIYILGKDKYGFFTVKQDLFALTVMHELYHAGKFKDSERKADDFAWDAFKLMYKRKPCFPRKYWRKIPK